MWAAIEPYADVLLAVAIGLGLAAVLINELSK